jgi:hypothetical protein
MNTTIKALVAAASVVGAMATGVAIASVDPAGYETAQEQQYIIDVTRDTGMVSTTPTEINDLIGGAHGACRAMAAGETPGQLIDVLATPPHPMPYGVATALVYDAIKDLCPYTVRHRRAARRQSIRIRGSSERGWQ